MGFISAIIKFFKKEQETKPLEQKDSAMNESPNIQNTNTDKKLKQEQKASVSNEKTDIRGRCFAPEYKIGTDHFCL
ncbi:hypothetical protein DWQ65_09620 [Treponema phagedenis]|uniref:Uncharacterized protein n=1 Tax=Treponema phagedenis TaxID=162 RepID=A0A0B7GW86_TREPH|nr:hypothetical protein [Treponema phagedenis]NVP24082.1 hypothetical protein [Treponema phagedenis]QEK07460.1 hypothetical protein FUT80_12515 [Treponema phagedenis]QLC59606.1 hypothetical protein HW453_12940 [Treponema phagedenis]QSH95682.1 hypothetical protein C5O78_11805 [Treponema phagedenis]QSI00310.1 hypothetical protein DWQ65_09620 [Treponema phagedenis]